MTDFTQRVLFGFGPLFLLGLGVFIYYWFEDRRRNRKGGAGRREG